MPCQRQKMLNWGMGFCWYHTETFFMFTFTLNFFLSGYKFSFACNIWACLSANITIHNVVTGIIKKPQKLWLPDIVEFMHFSLRTQTFITILALYFRRCCTRHASFMISGFDQFIFKEKCCMKVLFFANRGHLQVLKVSDLKLLCPSQLCTIKDRIINVGI